MEVIKGLFGKAQAAAEEVVQSSTKKDDGYSRDVSTCPGKSPSSLKSINIAGPTCTLLTIRLHCQVDKGDGAWYDSRVGAIGITRQRFWQGYQKSRA